jgi:hypothetical protein
MVRAVDRPNPEKKEGNWRGQATSPPRDADDYLRLRNNPIEAVLFKFGAYPDTSEWSQILGFLMEGRQVPGLAGDPVNIAGVNVSGVKRLSDLQHPGQYLEVGPKGVTASAAETLKGIFNQNLYAVAVQNDDGTWLPIIFPTPGKDLRTEEPTPFELMVRAMLEGRMMVAYAGVVGDQFRTFEERMYSITRQGLNEIIAIVARKPYEDTNKLFMQELSHSPDLSGRGKEYLRLARMGEILVEQGEKFTLSDEQLSYLKSERNVRAQIMAYLGQYYMAKARRLEQVPNNEDLKQELRDISLIMVQYAEDFNMIHLEGKPEDYGRPVYKPLDADKDYFYQIKREGNELTWEAVNPKVLSPKIKGVSRVTEATWLPLEKGRKGRVAIPISEEGKSIQLIFEPTDGSGIILRNMLKDGEEAIVPVMRPQGQEEFLNKVISKAKDQTIQDGEISMLWPPMVKNAVSWRDEKAAEIDQRKPDAKIKPSLSGGVEIQFNKDENNQVSFTQKWSLPAGQTVQFVRLAPGKRVNLNKKSGEQVFVNVIKGELTNINRGVFTNPNTVHSTLVTEDSFEFQVGEFGDSLDAINPLLKKFGQSKDAFKNIQGAVDWLNASIDPYVEYRGKNKIDPIIGKLLPGDFQTMTDDQLKALAFTDLGQEIKREILNQDYQQETPKRPIVVVAGSKGAIIQVVTQTPQAAVAVTDMNQLQFSGPLANELAWKKVEDLPWWKGEKNIDFWNASGFHIMEAGNEVANLQYWKLGAKVNAGEHDHSGDITNPFVEKHLVLSGTGGRMVVKGGISLPVNPGEEHGFMGGIDQKTGQALRRPNGTVQYPVHSFQAGDQPVFWQVTEIHPDLLKVTPDKVQNADKAATAPKDLGGIDLTGNYNLRIQKEAGAKPIDIPANFLQGIDVKGLFPVLINDEPVVIPELLGLTAVGVK